MTDTPVARMLSTQALANAVGVKANSIRGRLCKHGSYYGIKPRKLPNGRLLWPVDSVELFLNQSDSEAP